MSQIKIRKVIKEIHPEEVKLFKDPESGKPTLSVSLGELLKKKTPKEKK